MNTNLKNTLIAALTVVALTLTALPAMAAEETCNVNTAGVSELALLPRIGPALAQRIVEHREENGPFKSVEDLMLVRGIGERTFELLAPFVKVEGETSLMSKVSTARAEEAVAKAAEKEDVKKDTKKEGDEG